MTDPQDSRPRAIHYRPDGPPLAGVAGVRETGDRLGTNRPGPFVSGWDSTRKIPHAFAGVGDGVRQDWTGAFGFSELRQRSREIMQIDLARGTRVCLCSLMAIVLGAIGLPGIARAQGADAQPDGQMWSLVARAPASEPASPEWVRPPRGQVVSLDFDSIKKLLVAAPWEDTDRARKHPLVIVLPDPNGNWQRFAVMEYSVMEPALAAAHPELHTYRGEGLDDPYATLRCSTTTIGFQAQVLTISEAEHGGAWHIDPRTRGDLSSHTSYYRNDASDLPRRFTCQTVDNAPARARLPLPLARHGRPDAPPVPSRSGVHRRNHRLGQRQNRGRRNEQEALHNYLTPACINVSVNLVLS